MHLATRTLRVLAGGLASVIAVMGIAVVPDAGLAARPSECATHDFQIREVPSSQGAAGSFILILSYRNVSRFSCQTGGWPGVTLYARGRALPATRRTGPKGPRLVVKPGGSVYSKVSYVESPQSGRICRKVIPARVIAPNSTQSSLVHLPHGSVWCGTSISVAPMGATVARATP